MKILAPHISTDPATVRPESVLKKTIKMLREKWQVNEDYDYICEQLKSVRQDLTVSCSFPPLLFSLLSLLPTPPYSFIPSSSLILIFFAGSKNQKWIHSGSLRNACSASFRKRIRSSPPSPLSSPLSPLPSPFPSPLLSSPPSPYPKAQGDLGEFNQCQTQLRDLYREGLSNLHVAEFTAYRILYFLHVQGDVTSVLADIPILVRKEPAVEHSISGKKEGEGEGEGRRERERGEGRKGPLLPPRAR